MARSELDPTAVVEAVSDRVGYGPGAWDVVPPEDLVAAFREVLAPRSEAEERLIQAALSLERYEEELPGGEIFDRSMLSGVCEAAAEVRRLREGSNG